MFGVRSVSRGSASVGVRYRFALGRPSIIVDEEVSEEVGEEVGETAVVGLVIAEDGANVRARGVADGTSIGSCREPVMRRRWVRQGCPIATMPGTGLAPGTAGVGVGFGSVSEGVERGGQDLFAFELDRGEEDVALVADAEHGAAVVLVTVDALAEEDRAVAVVV